MLMDELLGVPLCKLFFRSNEVVGERMGSSSNHTPDQACRTIIRTGGYNGLSCLCIYKSYSSVLFISEDAAVLKSIHQCNYTMWLPRCNLSRGRKHFSEPVYSKCSVVKKHTRTTKHDAKHTDSNF